MQKVFLHLFAVVILTLGVGVGPAAAQAEGENEGDFLYRVVMVRAAPGGLLDLIELYKEERDLLEDAQEVVGMLFLVYLQCKIQE